MMSGIQTYQPTGSKPWNEERVMHLYRRLGMGATPLEIKEGLLLTPEQLVDQLIDRVIQTPLPARPYWADYTDDDFEDDDEFYAVRDELRNSWFREMITDGVRPRLVLFWHNHFVTELDVYFCNKYLWSYFEMLHEYCLGNFKEFVKTVGVNPAMLVYLNGNINVVGRPNENYARELMELFTLGESNGYTQVDVAEMSRALTGWRANPYRCEDASFDPSRFDNSQKTIFGQTGSWNYNDVHDLIFTHRAEEVSLFIVEKLYRHFVYDQINPQIVAELAQTFRNNNWEIAPVLRQLFKSEHFFDSNWICSHISSPLDVLTKWSRITQLTPEDIGDRMWVFRWGPYDLGMDIFNPVNVAGWPGYHAWINENTYTQRIRFIRTLSESFNEEAVKNKLLDWATDLAPAPNDPAGITGRICLQVLGKAPEPEILNSAIDVFKSDIPSNYYEDGSWNLYWESAPMQIIGLLRFLMRLPELQLN